MVYEGKKKSYYDEIFLPASKPSLYFQDGKINYFINHPLPDCSEEVSSSRKNCCAIGMSDSSVFTFTSEKNKDKFWDMPLAVF